MTCDNKAGVDLRAQVPAANASTGAPPGTQERLFKIWTYQTQLWQARAYETGMSLWRRLKADASASTMGILCAPPGRCLHEPWADAHVAVTFLDCQMLAALLSVESLRSCSQLTPNAIRNGMHQSASQPASQPASQRVWHCN